MSNGDPNLNQTPGTIQLPDERTGVENPPPPVKNEPPKKRKDTPEKNPS